MNKLNILCLVLLGFPAVAEEQHNLESIVKTAVSNNPQVKQRFSQFLISKQDQEIAEAGHLPNVDLTAESSDKTRNFGQTQDFVNNQAQLNIVQNIFNGLLTSSEIGRLHEASKVRYFELKAEIENIALETTFAYLDVLLYRQQLSSAEENLKTHITVYKQVEESSNAGISRGVDLEQISGRLALAESNVMTEQANLYDVSARFLRLVGTPPPAELVKPEIDNIEEKLIVLLKEAHTKNPSLIAALYNVYSQREGVASAKSRNRPNLDVVAGLNTQSRGPLGEEESRTESQVGLRLSWNLFNGGEDTSRIEQALTQVDLALNQHEQVCRDIKQTLQIAYNEVSNLKKQIPVLNDHKLSSSSVKSAYLDQFKIGKRNLLDVLDTENEAFEASRAHAEATYSLLKANYRIFFGIGILGKKLNIEQASGELDSENLPYHPDYVCPQENKNNGLSNSDVLNKDSDNDGVSDLWDDCEDTKPGEEVNNYGCPITTNKTVDNSVKKINVEVNFLLNSSELNKDVGALLEEAKKMMIDNKNYRAVIKGHTSLEGGEIYNKNLSQQRANAVKQWLITEANIDESRITAIGVGTSEPLIKENTEEAHKRNRRIELEIVKQDL